MPSFIDFFAALYAPIKKLEDSCQKPMGRLYWLILSFCKSAIIFNIKLLTSIKGTEAAYYRTTLVTFIAWYIMKS
jgi:drug/metabolite transporter (DMT)-like permease